MVSHNLPLEIVNLKVLKDRNLTSFVRSGLGGSVEASLQDGRKGEDPNPQVLVCYEVWNNPLETRSGNFAGSLLNKDFQSIEIFKRLDL